MKINTHYLLIKSIIKKVKLFLSALHIKLIKVIKQMKIDQTLDSLIIKESILQTGMIFCIK